MARQSPSCNCLNVDTHTRNLCRSKELQVPTNQCHWLRQAGYPGLAQPLPAQAAPPWSQRQGLWGREGCDEPSVAAETTWGRRDKASGDVWHHRFDATSCIGRRPCQRLVAFSLLGPHATCPQTGVSTAFLSLAESEFTWVPAAWVEKKASFPGNEETLHCCKLIQILSGRPLQQGRLLCSGIFGTCVPVHRWCGLTVIKHTCFLQKPGHASLSVLCWRSLTAGLGLSIRVLNFLSHHSTRVLVHWNRLQQFQRDQSFLSSLSWALLTSRWHLHSQQ